MAVPKIRQKNPELRSVKTPILHTSGLCLLYLDLSFWLQVATQSSLSFFFSVTTRANHGRDTLLEYDLSKVDG